MPLGLFLVTASVALLWSGLKNKDLREAIPLFLQNKDPDDAKPISKALPSDEPMAFGFSDTEGAANLGGQVTWSRTRVAAYGIALTNRNTPWPSARVGGQCRNNNVRPPGGAANSLHYVKNGCRALDISGSDAHLLKLERWAKAQGVFAEVIYSNETNYHRTGGANNHLHLGFPKSGKQPIIPGSQSGGGSGGGSF